VFTGPLIRGVENWLAEKSIVHKKTPYHQLKMKQLWKQ